MAGVQKGFKLPDKLPTEGERHDWRVDVINNIHSECVLYYFNLTARTKKNSNWSYSFRCRCCNGTRAVVDGSGWSNLSGRIYGQKGKGPCEYVGKPRNPEVRPFRKGMQFIHFDVEASAVSVHHPKTNKRLSKSVASNAVDVSRDRMSEWLLFCQDQNENTRVLIQRRATLVWVVMTAQPFSSPSNLCFRITMAAGSPTASFQDAFKSPRTLVRDLKLLYDSIFDEAVQVIKNSPGRFKLQHHSWTTPKRRTAFIGVHDSWVDADWSVRSACIGFDRLGIDHTGASFAGHLAGILDRTGLWFKWSGIIVSDAAEANVRAARFLKRKIDSDMRTLPDSVQSHLKHFSVLKQRRSVLRSWSEQSSC
ncbi:hypothetical protein A4X09_0g7486 [Tilletia walkeri]|uniref:Uncharacterized protein n=1 Tax=Tilletia walkeri TaxID=117179 RepID=A0A8X7N3E7_9BASI|nr:hypothetical protein A4X09_0g7486 [Tilletia walkeri]